jgi:hypothetical protein
MKSYLACSSVVTKKSFEEFLLLDYSISQFHDVKWYLSTDPYSYERIKGMGNKYNCLLNIESDKKVNHHGEATSESQKIAFMDVVKTKLFASRYGLESGEEFVLFMDTDIIFVNPIEAKVLKLFKNKDIDGFVCPHSTDNHSNEAKVGFFNSGMYATSSFEFLDAWIALNERSLELNLFCDQKPLEIIYRDFLTVNLPMNYNVGFWKMNEQHNSWRCQHLGLNESREFVFLGKNVIFLHAHTFKKLHYVNYGSFLIEKMLLCLDNSNRSEYENILDFMSKLSLEKFYEIC